VYKRQLIAFNSLAGKTYTYELTVRSLFEHTTLEGIQVKIVEKEGATYNFTTNEEGKITAVLQKKEFNVEIVDTTGNHRSYSFAKSFYKETVRKDEMEMRLSEELEEKLIESKIEPEGIEHEPEDFIVPCSDSVVPATFKGGIPTMMRYIAFNIIYPQACIEQDIQGKVYVRFKVHSNGEIGDIKIIRGLIPETDNEVIRLLSYMPNFVPATCNGVAVESYFQMPINFTLE
jgi:TonB family protein